MLGVNTVQITTSRLITLWDEEVDVILTSPMSEKLTKICFAEFIYMFLYVDISYLALNARNPFLFLQYLEAILKFKKAYGVIVLPRRPVYIYL